MGSQAAVISMDAHAGNLALNAMKTRRPTRRAPSLHQREGLHAMRRASSSRCTTETDKVDEMEQGGTCGGSGAAKVVAAPSTSRHNAAVQIEREAQLLAGVDGGGGVRVQLPALVRFE